MEFHDHRPFPAPVGSLLTYPRSLILRAPPRTGHDHSENDMAVSTEECGVDDHFDNDHGTGGARLPWLIMPLVYPPFHDHPEAVIGLQLII